ncbi:MAG: carbon storage regulator [Thermoguttaceae bacterium]
MLLLTRKIGQQVVLPKQGITIDVVDVGKTRVRLGISAPSDTPIHRREAWDRAHGTANAPPTSRDNAPERLPVDESKSPMAAASSFADFDQWLARRITRRTSGGIGRLSVETHDNRIVIRGSARSLYARRSAQDAVQEVFDLCDGLPRCHVEYDIDIGGDESAGFRDTRVDSSQNV